MSISNQSARCLMDALEILREVEAVDLVLEKTSIQHKIASLLTKERSEGMTGRELVDDMSDDELAWAIAQPDSDAGKKLGLYKSEFIDPFLFNYLRQRRPRALAIGDSIRLGRRQR